MSENDAETMDFSRRDYGLPWRSWLAHSSYGESQARVPGSSPGGRGSIRFLRLSLPPFMLFAPLTSLHNTPPELLAVLRLERYK